MKIAIMQPYFMPYIGYFQLMNAVDEFIVYDNIEYTKSGWINRNRILQNGADTLITLPLKKDSDYRHVKDRCLADSWPRDRMKMLNRIGAAYAKASQFSKAFPVIENCIMHDEPNLFKFILNALNMVKDYLSIKTPLVISSEIPVDHELKSQDKVLALCKARLASAYINPIGGLSLYSREEFQKENIELWFLKARETAYDQSTGSFVPWLSIIDVMMFNTKEAASAMLAEFDLV